MAWFGHEAQSKNQSSMSMGLGWRKAQCGERRPSCLLEKDGMPQLEVRCEFICKIPIALS